MARRTFDHDPSPDDPDRDPEWDPEWDPAQDDDDTDSSGGGAADGSTDTAFCPECGAEIFDAADVCPKCYSWIDGETTRHPPRRGRAKDRWIKLVAWILIAAIVIGAGLFGILAI